MEQYKPSPVIVITYNSYTHILEWTTEETSLYLRDIALE